MMTIDFYNSAHENKCRKMTLDDFKKFLQSSVFEEQYKKLIVDCRESKDFGKNKAFLPAWTPMGASNSGQRKTADMTPTPILMIDIDHVDNIDNAIMDLRSVENLLGLHVTPSGKGLRLFLRYEKDFESVEQHLDYYAKELNLSKYGDVDKACKDLTRLSFLVPWSEWKIFDLENAGEFCPIKTKSKSAEVVLEEPSEAEDELRSKYADYSYNGILMSDIISEYIKDKGQPEAGGRHIFYNSMARDFRHICNNNAEVLCALLPDFGKPYAERMAQCKYFCKNNVASKIPLAFYKWLNEKNYYKKKEAVIEEETEETNYIEKLDAYIKAIPTLPPVFREFVACAPKDFKIPTINALLPIMGTMTSFLRADYFDAREHSTSFFSVLYAPAGHGKSFPEKLIETLWKRFELRDKISEFRERIYNSILSTKSDQQKDKEENPNVSMRRVPANISQPELLTKMCDNKGYHILTYEPEIDTWRKGSKAASNDKSDIIRVAWDNGLYGQSFKSVNTFKGSVKLYWNVLITGTPNAMLKYFSNVEDGLVTRCSFCSLGNQRFASAPIWKSLNNKQMEVVKKFVDYCDMMTYEEELNCNIELLQNLSPKDFVETVPWQFKFKPFVHVDMSWIFPKLMKWLECQREYSSETLDDARDTFRRRVAVKGFRLALLCNALYKRIGKNEQKLIWNFVDWWMSVDLENSLYLWQQKYNEAMQNSVETKKTRFNVVDDMPEYFTKEELGVILRKRGIMSSVKQVIYILNKNGLIKKTIKDGVKQFINLKKQTK